MHETIQKTGAKQLRPHTHILLPDLSKRVLNPLIQLIYRRLLASELQCRAVAVHVNVHMSITGSPVLHSIHVAIDQ